MKEYLNEAIQAACDAGASYADIRIVDTESEELSVKNGKIEEISVEHRFGYGIRVIASGAWGFAAGTTFTRDAIREKAKQAVSIALASSSINRQKISLVPCPVHQDVWHGVCLIDPRDISLEQKISYLLECDSEMAKVKGITLREAHFSFEWIHKWFAHSDGSLIEQSYPVTGLGITATAMRGDDMQVRSYPNSASGQVEGRGYELIDTWDIKGAAQRTASEAVALLDAPPCPEGKMTVIIDSTQLSLQIHESCGHAVELDRVLGSEINDYGTSFLTTDKLGSYRYGSPIVNLVADPTISGGLGSFGFDDEGVPGIKTYLVKDGIFRNYLSSRETAGVIGQNRSNASMRAQDFNFIPLIRMTNVNLEPGTMALDDMIADTDNGVLIAVNKSFSIDDRRWQFQFGTEIGWLIKRGKITDMVKNPVYSGLTPQFWQSCNAIADERSWILWGVPNCGKGQPDQGAKVSHGCSPARFQNIQMGRNHG